MNYPRVCFACSMPHIRQEEDEVVTPDGKRSFAKSCLELPGAEEKFKKYFEPVVAKEEEENK